MIRDLTAAERMRIGAALGRPALRAADTLRVQLNEHGKAPASLWRAFLRALMDGAGDAMSSPIGMALQLAIIGKIQEREMKTMTQERATEAQERASLSDRSIDKHAYKGIRLEGTDTEKLVALCDAILFYVQVQHLRTSPIIVQESEGCVTVYWSRYASAAFSSKLPIDLVVRGTLVDHLTIQGNHPGKSTLAKRS